MNLCGCNLFERMREDLRPQETAQIVRLIIADASYYDLRFVQRAVEWARSRVIAVAVGLDEFNEFEQLGMRALPDSAYLGLPKGANACASAKK